MESWSKKKPKPTVEQEGYMEEDDGVIGHSVEGYFNHLHGC